jgi:hypothetical protein
MKLPIFSTQPNEVNDLQPAVMDCIRKEGFSVYSIDGLFDVLISGGGRFDSYIELKIRLESQNYKCPITPKQWHLLNSHQSTDNFEDNYRVLIYDYRDGGSYALVSASNLSIGITGNQPNDTSYISNECLDSLEWGSLNVTHRKLFEWLRR